MSPSLRAILYALAAFALFSTHDVFVKLLGSSYSPFQIVFFSVLFGFPLVMMLLLRDETVGTLIPKHPWWTLARTIAAVITGACAFYAFSVLPLAQTYAIIFASPLLITVLAIPILGERVGFRRGIAVLVGLAGVMVVLQPGASEFTLGHLAALGCAVFGAFGAIVVRKIGREERSVVLILYPMVANFVLMAALLPWVYEPMPLQDLGLSFLVAFFALMAMNCLILAYRYGEAAIIAPMQYSQILWAALYGGLFFGERPAWNTWAGTGIIVVSGLYIVLREARGGQSENTPVLRTRSRVATPSAPRVGTFLDRSAKAVLEDEPMESKSPPGLRGLPGRGGPRR
ncbi:MAG: DMT family transporter [Marinovum sp.]|nr:DMT family transporter [Marinovum sp.]